MAQGKSIHSKDYSLLIEDYQKRLARAQKSHDQSGQRHEHFHLGYAYLNLLNFDKSLDHYRQALSIAEAMEDLTSSGQINFILGRLYSLKQDYDLSIRFHEKHLEIARQCQDVQGQSRACLILRRLREKVNQLDRSKQLNDLGKSLNTTDQEKQKSLKAGRLETRSISVSEGASASLNRSNSTVDEKSTNNVSRKFRLNILQHLTKKPANNAARKESLSKKSDELFDLVCRMQDSRFDDQRCADPLINCQKKKSFFQTHRSSAQLDQIVTNVDQSDKSKKARLSPLNEQFFDQLSKCQGSRFDDQRAVLTPLTTHRTSNKTLPDEDSLALFDRLERENL